MLLLFICAYFFDLNPHRPLKKNFPEYLPLCIIPCTPFSRSSGLISIFTIPTSLSCTHTISTSLADTGSHRSFLPQGNPIHPESFCVSETSHFGQCMYQIRDFASLCCCCSAFESLKKIMRNNSQISPFYIEGRFLTLSR